MADILLVLAGEEVGIDMAGGERANGERRYELLCSCRHDRPHLRAALAQAADEVEALVGGDAARDDEKDAFSCKRHGKSRALMVAEGRRILLSL